MTPWYVEGNVPNSLGTFFMKNVFAWNIDWYVGIPRKNLFWNPMQLKQVAWRSRTPPGRKWIPINQKTKCYEIWSQCPQHSRISHVGKLKIKSTNGHTWPTVWHLNFTLVETQTESFRDFVVGLSPTNQCVVMDVEIHHIYTLGCPTSLHNSGKLNFLVEIPKPGQHL